MKIAGFQKNSFVDYPGKIAAVLFAPGCNLDCYYCHNRILLKDDIINNLIPIDQVLDSLDKRKDFLDAVVISGGEPTLQAHLVEFILSIKKMDFDIKLDTNGTNPGIVEELIDRGLLDYIAMDIKAPFDKYKNICGGEKYLDNISCTVNLLMGGKVDYEFRTTFSPRLRKKDILLIAKKIKGSKRYVLQQFRNMDEEGNLVLGDGREKPHSREYIKEVVDSIKNMGLIKDCYTRGL